MEYVQVRVFYMSASHTTIRCLYLQSKSSENVSEIHIEYIDVLYCTDVQCFFFVLRIKRIKKCLAVEKRNPNKEIQMTRLSVIKLVTRT